MATRETTREREARFRAEYFAAIRATPTYIYWLIELANTPHDAEFSAGERITIKPGRRQPEQLDEGQVQQLALADTLKARGYDVISHGTRFGIAAGRDSIRYTVGVRNDQR